MIFSKSYIQNPVPIACFRQSPAREYAETYPVPPLSTVYGMLLSLVSNPHFSVFSVFSVVRYSVTRA
ncbi:CRISPR-associated protein Cas5 [Aphanizomenon flos-aquae]|uniref:CRISPR-associated protein Cas5 n=1 Tax=Aphanizomenon flos-aquae TaxID=1176 RepID=UPI003BB1BBF4